MWTKHTNGISSIVHGLSGLCRLSVRKTWHFRHDWLFTPFVVVVGGKYFFAGAGVPSFWLGHATIACGRSASLGRFRNF